MIIHFSKYNMKMNDLKIVQQWIFRINRTKLCLDSNKLTVTFKTLFEINHKKNFVC